MSNYDSVMMRAIDKARELPYKHGRYRHYAIITDKRGIVVSEGHNNYIKTHPTFAKLSAIHGNAKAIYCHAEFTALLRDKTKRGYRLYVARVDSTGQPVNSKPCPVCWAWIDNYENIKSVQWT